MMPPSHPASRPASVAGAAVRNRRSVGLRSARGDAAASKWGRPAALIPCVVYLIIEFGRPGDWVPALAVLRPGLLASVWGFAAVLFLRQRPVPRPIWYMFGFLALMAYHVPTAYNNYWAYRGFEAFAVMLLGGVLPLSVLPDSRRSIRFLLVGWFWIHVPIALYAVTHHGRGPGTWTGDENDLALALNVALGITVYLWIERRSMLLIAGMGLFLAAIVASQSRGGFVGLAGLGLFLLVSGPHRRVVATFAVLAVIGLLLLAPAGYWQEVQSIGDSMQPGDTGDERLYSWRLGWRMFLDEPVLGVGTYNYAARVADYQEINAGNLDSEGHWRRHMWGRTAHSLYFTLIPEHGVVGVALFAAMVGWAVRAVLRIRRRYRAVPDDEGARSDAMLASALAAGIFAVLATGTFLSVLYYPILWALVSLLGAHVGTLGPTDAPAPGAAPVRARRPPGGAR